MPIPMMHYCPGKPFTEMSTLERITILRNNRAARIPPEKPKEKPAELGAGGKPKRKATTKRKAADPESAALKLLAKLPAAQREKLLAAMRAKQEGN